MAKAPKFFVLKFGMFARGTPNLGAVFFVRAIIKTSEARSIPFLAAVGDDIGYIRVVEFGSGLVMVEEDPDAASL